MRFGDLVTVPKKANEVHVVLNEYQGILMLANKKGGTFFTRKSSCEKVETH